MVSGFLADQVEQEMESSRSFSHLLAGAIAAPTTTTTTTSSSGALVVGENNQGLGEELAESSRPGSSPGGNGAGGGGAGGSFADRLAARGAANTSSSSSAGVAAAAAGSAEAGGGAPRPPSSSVRFGSLPPSRIPIPRSAGYLTIPPGLSPTTLFDSSPVLLSTSQVMDYDQTLAVVVADNDDDLLFLLVDVSMNLSRDVCMCMYVCQS
jgi:hypothetical protein